MDDETRERILGVTCLACFAKPGDPCHTPTSHGRRNVDWFHLDREVSAGVLWSDTGEGGVS